jgi:hypothetical protein
MRDPARQPEDVDGSRPAELGDRRVECPFDVREVVRDVVPAEELVGQRAPAGEQFVGDLAPQHAPVGDALARLLFGERVEGRDAGRREREEVAIVAAVDDEGVADLRARVCERRDRVGHGDVPRQSDGAGDRWHRLDGRSHHVQPFSS